MVDIAISLTNGGKIKIKMDKKKLFKNIANAITNILVVASILLLFFALFTAYKFKENPEDAYLFGYKPVLILTGSMEPTMHVNGVVIVEKTTYEDVKEGDIIMYKVNDKMITHRIIEKSSEGITTKGDNNQTEDAYLLTEENIQAKVVKIWNWTAKPLNEIFPEGFGEGTVNKKAIAKWIGFPIFIIVVLKLLLFAIKKINKMDDEPKKDKNEES